jgi:hypothetical protein
VSSTPVSGGPGGERAEGLSLLYPVWKPSDDSLSPVVFLDDIRRLL